ncbi:MAG: ABC transporter substrate-binding protein, partial [Deltaproteobacteria bacterium]|nr:ABC transporter substrate-binding protein [Deltaproteobacteria bacterium]
MRPRWSVQHWAIIVGSLLIAGAIPASAGERLYVTYITPSPGSQAPVWIARDAGFLERNGIEAVLVFVDGSPRGMQAVLSGDAQVSTGPGTATVNARLAGGDVVMFATTINILPYYVITAPDIRTVEDLRGKTGANHIPGTSADFAVRIGLARLGLDPNRDVRFQTVGGSHLRLTAVMRGLTKFMVGTEPERLEAVRHGLKVLVDLATLDIPFPMDGLVTTERLIRSRPETIQRFTKALVETLHFYQHQKESSIRIMQRYSRLRGHAAGELRRPVVCPPARGLRHDQGALRPVAAGQADDLVRGAPRSWAELDGRLIGVGDPVAEPPSDDARPSLRAFVTLLLLLGGLGLLVLFWAAQTVPRQYPPELIELRAYALELAGQLRRGEIDGTRFHALLKQRARITRERLRLP